MKTQIIGKNIEVTDAIRANIEKKLKKMDKYLVINEDVSCRVVVRSYKNGSKVEDVDYKAYDRWMKNGNNVVVKHGQTKYIRFYVNGSITWPDYEDYTLFAKIKFEGETYNWHVWYCDSAYQESGKWYNTYWNDEAYQNWLY